MPVIPVNNKQLVNVEALNAATWKFMKLWFLKLLYLMLYLITHKSGAFCNFPKLVGQKFDYWNAKNVLIDL